MFMHVLVTGANGFVGSRLGEYLRRCGHRARLATRRLPEGASQSSGEMRACGEVNGKTDWSTILQDIEAVIHLVAPAHARQPPTERDMDAVNVEGSVNLFRQMREVGARRMVYLSTIKVNGEQSGERAFGRSDTPQPQDAYGRSKYRAETALMRESERGGPDLVIVRSPLVHGVGVKGNLRRLLRLIRSGAPLPFRAIDNKRSMVGLHNLHSFLEKCATQASAGNNMYMVSDGEDISTPNLARVLCRAMGRSARLWPLPLSLLRALGRLSGRAELVERLCGNLQVDISDSVDELQWRPPQTLHAGLQEMARAFER